MPSSQITLFETKETSYLIRLRATKENRTLWFIGESFIGESGGDDILTDRMGEAKHLYSRPFAEGLIPVLELRHPEYRVEVCCLRRVECYFLDSPGN